MRPHPRADIRAPEFPRQLEWLNVATLRMRDLIGRSVVLIEFWDYARINSLRTLPYLEAWHERYAEHGLRVILVHSPGYSFGRDREAVERAVARLELPFPVALDTDFELWREYGNRGWPGRYVFDRRGRLRLLHYGEGEYEDSERAVQEALAELDPTFEPPREPLDPLRPEDEPGILLEAQTADVVLPADRERLELVRDWLDGDDYIEAKDAGSAASVSFTAGGAWAVLSGADIEPGLHQTDGTVVAESPGVRLHGFQFTPLPPSAT